MEKVLEKSYRILETLAASKNPRGVTELSLQLGLVKSNVHRLLGSLVELGLVRQVLQSEKKYALTLKLWQLGSAALDNLDVRRIARPYMHEVVSRFEEDAYLSDLVGRNVVYIEHMECSHAVRATMGVGHEAYCSSTGKAMLAWLPPETLLPVMTDTIRFTTTTITDLESMHAELRTTRERGYAMNMGEWRSSVHGVAAPIFDHTGQPVAALGISGPAGRLPLARVEEIGKALVEVTRRMSTDMGHVPSEAGCEQLMP